MTNRHFPSNPPDVLNSPHHDGRAACRLSHAESPRESPKVNREAKKRRNPAGFLLVPSSASIRASSWHGCISHHHARHNRTHSRYSAAFSQARPLRPTNATRDRSSQRRVCVSPSSTLASPPSTSYSSMICERPSPLACIPPDGTMEDAARCARRRPKRNGTAP